MCATILASLSFADGGYLLQEWPNMKQFITQMRNIAPIHQIICSVLTMAADVEQECHGHSHQINC
jgi:hypothetical protein